MAKPSAVEEALNRLETDLRQLKIEYDAYFSGGRQRPPTEVEWRVQRAVKQLNENRKMKYGDRFRFNNLTQRYAKYSEVWRRRGALVEQGRSAFTYSKTARELDNQRLQEASEGHERYLSGERPAKGPGVHVGLADPNTEGESVQKLYKAMMESKKQAGEAANISYDQFHKFVQQKTSQMKQKMGVDRVEFSVDVQNGRVTLKARGEK